MTVYNEPSAWPSPRTSPPRGPSGSTWSTWRAPGTVRRPMPQSSPRLSPRPALHVELGGGIRSLDTARRYLDAGVSRIILGTAALTQPEFLAQALRAKFGDRVAVGVDCRDGLVAIRGWTQTSAVTCEDFCQQLQDLGVQTVICTDISKDGAMQGANLGPLPEARQNTCPSNSSPPAASRRWTISAPCSQMGLYGAIIGKALLHRRDRPQANMP